MNLDEEKNMYTLYKEGVAIPMLIFPKGAADKMEKINITEFDVILFFFIFLSFLLATVYIK